MACIVSWLVRVLGLIRACRVSWLVRVLGLIRACRVSWLVRVFVSVTLAFFNDLSILKVTKTIRFLLATKNWK